jgi:LysM repeat protein
VPAVPSKDFLTSKAGPLPVWGWGAAGLGAAYAYSRYKANQAAAQGNGTTSTTNAAGESTAAAPQFVIENNEPWGAGATSSTAPVTVTPTPPVPVTTPPGTSTTPPVTTTTSPVLQGGNPPSLLDVAPAASGPAPAQSTTTAKPAAKAPTAYKVQAGDTLSSIAAKFHTTASALFSYNTGASSPHSAAARAQLLKQGPNLIYSGQTIYIPQ